MNPTPIVRIWTDGACTGNGHAHARGGCGVYIPPPHDVKIAKPIVGPTSNNIAELTAIKIALTWVDENVINPDTTTIHIITDSAYSIGCLTSWRAGWERNNMKTSKKEPVKNAELIAEMWTMLDGLRAKRISVEFVHVAGHQNPKTATPDQLNNIIVDKLAVAGITQPGS